jgi:hypothetical protein
MPNRNTPIVPTPPVTPPVPTPVINNVTNNGMENWMLEGFKKIAELNTAKAVILLLFLTLCFIVIKQQDKIIDMGQAYLTRTAKLHDTALTDAVINDRQVGAILGTLLREQGASRALLFQFHNGTESLRGVPFLFATATGERVATGIATSQQQMSRIDIRTIITFLPTFLKGDCIDKKFEDADAALKDAMSSVATQRILACPVFVPGAHEPAGYVSLTYTQGFTAADPATTFVTMKVAATLLGATLGAYLDGKK